MNGWLTVALIVVGYLLCVGVMIVGIIGAKRNRERAWDAWLDGKNEPEPFTDVGGILYDDEGNIVGGRIGHLAPGQQVWIPINRKDETNGHEPPTFHA